MRFRLNTRVDFFEADICALGAVTYEMLTATAFYLNDSTWVRMRSGARHELMPNGDFVCFSPDGRCVAWASLRTGGYEVFVALRRLVFVAEPPSDTTRLLTVVTNFPEVVRRKLATVTGAAQR